MRNRSKRIDDVRRELIKIEARAEKDIDLLNNVRIGAAAIPVSAMIGVCALSLPADPSISNLFKCVFIMGTAYGVDVQERLIASKIYAKKKILKAVSEFQVVSNKHVGSVKNQVAELVKAQPEYDPSKDKLSKSFRRLIKGSAIALSSIYAYYAMPGEVRHAFERTMSQPFMPAQQQERKTRPVYRRESLAA